ncbi:MAG: hypothetical protein NZ869_05135 [Thermoanaerobaculum sp.]|nr:hypothetical protein [Thermoanaerobaculum sp.]MDW7968124.1 FtsX-like permease family protein [Thermoanaerobaculum sp.]
MRQHLWREVRRQLGETRGMSLIALLLLAVGGAWWLLVVSFLQWGRQGLEGASARAVVVAVVHDGAPAEELLQRVQQRLPSANISLLSQETMMEALGPMVADLGSEAFLPQAVCLQVAAEQVPQVRGFLQQEPAVAVVISSQDWVSPLLGGFALALKVAAAFAFLLLLAFGTLVVLAVRVLVLSHADEIAIMRLIGAHERDIRLPYLVASALLGLLGATLALLLFLVARQLLLPLVVLPPVPWEVLAGTVVGGSVVGLIGAGLGVLALPKEP